MLVCEMQRIVLYAWIVHLQALPVQTFLHPDAHVDGGLAFVDKQLLESQRAAVLQLMKEVRRLQHCWCGTSAADIP